MVRQAGKTPKDALTPLELKIMQVLWEIGPSPVADVQARLQDDLAYTTVQTMLNVLLRKKKVKRLQIGRAFHYQPLVSHQRVAGTALKELVSRMFDGSAEKLLMALVDTRQITTEEIARATQLLETDKEKK
jgi:BlaI family penicillinase repressor